MERSVTFSEAVVIPTLSRGWGRVGRKEAGNEGRSQKVRGRRVGITTGWYRVLYEHNTIQCCTHISAVSPPQPSTTIPYGMVLDV